MGFDVDETGKERGRSGRTTCWQKSRVPFFCPPLGLIDPTGLSDEFRDSQEDSGCEEDCTVGTYRITGTGGVTVWNAETRFGPGALDAAEAGFESVKDLTEAIETIEDISTIDTGLGGGVAGDVSQFQNPFRIRYRQAS